MTDEKKSFIYIEFEEIGSAKLHVQMDNLTPLQILAASQYLDWKGKSFLAQQEIAEMRRTEASKIAVPNPPDIIIGKK